MNIFSSSENSKPDEFFTSDLKLRNAQTSCRKFDDCDDLLNKRDKERLSKQLIPVLRESSSDATKRLQYRPKLSM
jgi:hypothetical protein